MNALVTLQYEGSPFVFRDDGWFNATLAAKRHGKRPVEWLVSEDANSYMDALVAILKCEKSSLLQTRRGHHGGTWLHPKLAVRFAQWLDAKFAVWCDLQIDAIIRREVVVEPGDEEISSVGDRIPLLLAAVHALGRHGIALPTTYRAINKAGGSEHFRLMTVGQVRSVEPIARRIANKTDTQADWAALDMPDGTQNRLAGF